MVKAKDRALRSCRCRGNQRLQAMLGLHGESRGRPHQAGRLVPGFGERALGVVWPDRAIYRGRVKLARTGEALARQFRIPLEVIPRRARRAR